MIIAAGTKNPAKLEGIRQGFLECFGQAEVVSFDASTIAKPQPVGLDQMIEGAAARARFALSRTKADFGVGVEAGIFKVGRLYFDHQQAAVVDLTGKMSFGHSAGYMLPEGTMEKMISEGEELEQFAERISGVDRIGDKGGLVDFLTNGKVTRTELTRQCILTSLIPWLRRDLYSF